LQNVPQSVVAQYAVWKLGAVLVPLNIMFKEAELAYHLQDSGAVGIICFEEDLSRIESVARGLGLKYVIGTDADDGDEPLQREASTPKGAPGDSPFLWREILAAHRGQTPPLHRPGAGDVAYLHSTS